MFSSNLKQQDWKGRGRGDDAAGDMVKEVDPVLVVHPNYVIDA